MWTLPAEPSSAGMAPVDLEALADLLSPSVGGLSGPLRVEAVSGGRSQLVCHVTDGHQSWALNRRPPTAGPDRDASPSLAHAVHVLEALRARGVAVPPLVLACDDHAVSGAPFYVLEWVRGSVVRDQFPRGFARTPSARQEMSRAVVETLVGLHKIAPEHLGIEPSDSSNDVNCAEVRSIRAAAHAMGGEWVQRIDELCAVLLDTAPSPELSPSVVHGDFHLGNLMFSDDDPGRVVALLGWNGVRTGDPLVDLGFLLATWSDDDDDPPAIPLLYGAVPRDDGFFSRATITHEYAARRGAALTNLGWYVTLGYLQIALQTGAGRWLRPGATGAHQRRDINQLVEGILNPAIESARLLLPQVHKAG